MAMLMFRKNHATVWVLAVTTTLLGAACGADEPPVPTASPVTTSSVQTTTTTVVSSDTDLPELAEAEEDDVDIPTVSTTVLSDDVVGETTTTTVVPTTTTAVEPTTTTVVPTTTTVVPTTTTTRVVPEPVLVGPSVTEDLVGEPAPPAPVEAILSDDDSPLTGDPVVFLLPSTAEEVIGWSVKTAPVGTGGLLIVLDGWRVDHYPTSTGDADLVVTLFVSLVGDFDTSDGPSQLSLFYDGAREEGVQAAMGMRHTVLGLPEPVAVNWVDPLVWVPVVPGEERPLWFQWTVPSDTERLEILLVHEVKFLVFPQDPGVWGTTRETTISVSPSEETADLVAPCWPSSSRTECARYDLGGYEGAVMGVREEWDGGLAFYLSVTPPPSTREGMTVADLRFWYEGNADEVWYPKVDPWSYWAGQGSVGFVVDMPSRPDYLYMQWQQPDGTTLLWKTVGMVSDRLFDNPEWVWESNTPASAEAAAVETADRICWAYWTETADPYGLFPFPVLMVNGGSVTITTEMVDWVLSEVCSQ